MKTLLKIFSLLLAVICLLAQQAGAQSTNQNHEFDLQAIVKVKLAEHIGQLRAVPVNLGKGRPRAILAVHCRDAEVDPYVEMFFFPKDKLKLTLFTEKGEIL